MPTWPAVPGVPSVGHLTGGGAWHPGRAEGCPKCPTVRRVPATLYRTRAGRLHLTQRCSGGATPTTVRAVHPTQAEFEEAVQADKVCRCVRPYGH